MSHVSSASVDARSDAPPLIQATLADPSAYAVALRPVGWRTHLAWLLGALTVLALAALMNVRPNGEHVAAPLLGQLPELCTMKARLGLPCPGCGLTRSFISLARADFAAAWRYNPAGMLLFGFLLYQIPYRVVALGLATRGRAVLRHPTWATGACVVAVIVALLGQWLWRFGELWLAR